MKVPVLSVFLLAVSGCSNWPSASSGGGDHFAIIAEPTYLAAMQHETHVALLAQSEVLDAQTELMVLQGAKRCIPAAIVQLRQQSLKVRRQLGGSLFTDAATDIAAFQHQIRQVRWRFDSIRQQTQCGLMSTTEPQVQSTTRALTNHVGLFTVLFDSNSATVGSGYQRHLQLVAELVKECQCELLINGHTDQQGNEEKNLSLSEQRVSAVEIILNGLGVKAINRLASGETEPLLTRFADQPFNRRVDIIILPRAVVNSDISESANPLLLRQWADAGISLMH